MRKKPGHRAGFFYWNFFRLAAFIKRNCGLLVGRLLVGRTAIPSIFGKERIMPFQYCLFGNVKKQIQPGRLSGTW
ncbi:MULTISPECIES: hypothetical protein [Rhizobium]|uniref:hypothetical protein n=1 Tax=Rhizobium TaxID=379 RepID=UPI0011074C0F|nr:MULTISPECIES: hypothetical protein [Rhizobium]MBY3597349.1 hypothetical protein [Rhizobium bangladeshense]TLW96602.1 hypothetical protein FFR93_39405 [Rhizobium sp. MHM7A]